MSSCKHCGTLVLFGTMGHSKADIGGIQMHGINTTEARVQYSSAPI